MLDPDSPLPPRPALLVWAALLALVSLGSWVGFPAWVRHVTAAPVRAPVSLARVGAAEWPARVPIPEVYHVRLLFADADRAEFDTLRRLAAPPQFGGDSAGPGGVRAPLRWSLRRAADGALADSGSAAFLDRSRWTVGDTSAEVEVGAARVPPGRYRFRFEVLGPAPELAAFRARLVVSQGSIKDTRTWQMGAVFWGYLLLQPAGLVAGFGAAALLLDWLMRVVHHRRRGGAPPAAP